MTSKRIFVDSSVLVEKAKGTRLNDLTELASYDRADFAHACFQEGIRLVSHPDELSAFNSDFS
jgi:hypothetical protein